MGKIRRSVQDGKIREIRPFCGKLTNLVHYPPRLFLLCLRMKMKDLHPLRLSCKQFFRYAVEILGNDRIGHIQDIGRRAIILVQDNILVRSEIDESVRLGTTPLIDALIRVAHDEQVMMLGGKFLDYLPVVTVAILSLVYHDIVELFLPVGPHLWEIVKQVFGKIFYIIEIKGIVLKLSRHIATYRRRKHPL